MDTQQRLPKPKVAGSNPAESVGENGRFESEKSERGPTNGPTVADFPNALPPTPSDRAATAADEAGPPRRILDIRLILDRHDRVRVYADGHRVQLPEDVTTPADALAWLAGQVEDPVDAHGLASLGPFLATLPHDSGHLATRTVSDPSVAGSAGFGASDNGSPHESGQIGALPASGAGSEGGQS